jgi:hypothetical protein
MVADLLTFHDINHNIIGLRSKSFFATGQKKPPERPDGVG